MERPSLLLVSLRLFCSPKGCLPWSRRVPTEATCSQRLSGCWEALVVQQLAAAGAGAALPSNSSEYVAVPR